MDVDVINCLECFFIKCTVELRKLIAYGIDCNYEEKLLKTKLAFSYLNILKSSCTINNTLQTSINKFIRINCKNCG